MTKIKQPSQWNVRDVYILLMKEIEPELLPSNFQNLDAMYSEESEPDRKARYERYTKAFGLFLKRFDILITALKGKVSDISKKLQQELENNSDQQDKAILQNLTSIFQAS